MPEGTCSFGGCEAPAHARRLCKRHYKLQRRHGLLQPLTLEERFWSKVDRRGPDTCWPWLASIAYNGYGRFGIHSQGGTMTTAHRVAYELAVGPIPAGLVVDHLCGNRACCNPSHLQAVTQRVNVLRATSVAVTNAAKTHCPQGHPYDQANTRIERNGSRKCRACDRERHRKPSNF